MARTALRSAAALAVSLVVVGLVAVPAHAGGAPVTVLFGLGADATQFSSGPTLPQVPPQLGVTARNSLEPSVACSLRVRPVRATPDAVVVLDAALRQGCIRSYALSARPSAQPQAGRVVAAINGLQGRWDLLENGVPPDYYAESGIEGFRAANGDRLTFRLVAAKAGVPARFS